MLGLVVEGIGSTISSVELVDHSKKLDLFTFHSVHDSIHFLSLGIMSPGCTTALTLTAEHILPYPSCQRRHTQASPRCPPPPVVTLHLQFLTFHFLSFRVLAVLTRVDHLPKQTAILPWGGVSTTLKSFHGEIQMPYPAVHHTQTHQYKTGRHTSVTR